MNPLQRFAAGLLELQGAAVEPLEPEGLEVLTPPELQEELQLPELARLGFGVELPPEARRVGLESDWLERLAGLLGEHGRWQRLAIGTEAQASAGDPERILRHGLELLNATYRLKSVEPAWTRYLVLVFRYSALSDEKREGIVWLGLNLNNGATLDAMLERLLDELANAPRGEVPAAALPEPWTGERLIRVVQRALPGRIEQVLAPFVRGLERRQQRDLERLHEYHHDLRQEARNRLAALPTRKLNERQQNEKTREEQRLVAIEREYRAKVTDLRQKYALDIEAEWIQALEIAMPVQRLNLTLKRRKGEREFPLDWNPLTRKLEQAPCEYSYTPEGPRELCDARLHLLSPPAHGPCGKCGKPYCRVCYPERCPACGTAPAG